MKAYYNEHVAEEDKRLRENVFELPVTFIYLDRYLGPGNKVRVMCAGDEIPEIAERVEMERKNHGKPFRMPDQYPVCRTEVIQEGAYDVCPAGLSCKTQMKGRTFVLTGALEQYSLEEFVDKIVSLGGSNTSSVSDRAGYLVVGGNPGNKLDESNDNFQSK